MPFSGPNESTPYYKPVAPEVPVADNTAAKIIASGTGTLVSAFTQMAIARERAQLEHEQMLQHADIEAKQLGFDHEKLAQQYDLTTKQQALEDKLRTRGYNLESDRNDFEQAHLKTLDDYTKWKQTQDQNEFKTAFQRNMAFQKQRADMLDEAGQVADKLNLFDPKFQTEHPMEFAANALGFKNMYGSTTDDKLLATIKDFTDKAKASKVELDGTTYSWAQVAQDLSVNGTKSPFIQRLQAQGMMTAPEKSGKIIDSETGKAQFTSTKIQPNTEAARMLADAKLANFADAISQKSRVKPFAPKNATEAIAAGTLSSGGVVDNPKALSDPRTQAGGRLPSGTPLPPPDTDPLQVEADYVNKMRAAHPADADKFSFLFLQKYPGRQDLLQ